MDLAVIIFISTLAIFIPLAAMLLYVWHKFGRGQFAVTVARMIFLTGAAICFVYMLII
jgi:hypothetical protein